MKLIDPIIDPIIKHPSERTIFKFRFNKGLKQEFHFTEIKMFSHSCQNCQFSVCFDADIG